MPLPATLGRLELPVIGAPLFIASTPELVVAQCTAGIVGAFPALNARPPELLDEWLARIEAGLAGFAAAHPGRPVAPYAVNQVAHAGNARLERDMQACIDRKVPLVITSMRAPREIVDAVHGYGGLVFHDVVNVRHARKAAEHGVDGIIVVCAGAGGHTGSGSPFALVREIRQFYDGTLVLGGGISNGADVLAAQVIGADLAYVGTRFLATPEANVTDAYRRMIVESGSDDIVASAMFTGVRANYLRGSIAAIGLDPDAVAAQTVPSDAFAGWETRPRAWRDLWSAGQAVGNIHEVLPAGEVVSRLRGEYEAARRRLCGSVDQQTSGPRGRE